MLGGEGAVNPELMPVKTCFKSKRKINTFPTHEQERVCHQRSAANVTLREAPWPEGRRRRVSAWDVGPDRFPEMVENESFVSFK